MTGYLMDTPHTWGFYSELSPQYLNYVCLLSGHKPPPLGGKFTYCDLGCGNGVTLTALGEMYPEGEFIGVDLSATHVENGAALAEAAGLTNVRFLEMNFADLAGANLPDFDYIVAPGVYSYTDPEEREHLAHFIGRKLKSGGVQYLSYNALPGWSAITSLRDLMIQHTSSMLVDTPVKAQTALTLLHHLRDNNAGFFTDNPSLGDFLDEISGQELHYVVHEFFAKALKPFHFHQVAAHMRSVGLIYSGNACLNLNFVDIAVAADFHKMLREASSRIEFETLGDFIRNQRFRQDIYVKDAVEMEEAEINEALYSIPFGTICVESLFRREVQFGDVKLQYAANLFQLLIQHLSAGAKSIDELRQIDDFSAYAPELMLDALRFLSAGGQLVPFCRPTKPPDQAALDARRYLLPSKFNLAMIKTRMFQQQTLAFISPLAGVGFEVTTSDALFALCMAEAPRDQLADWVLQRMLETNQKMVFEEGSETEAIENSLRIFRDVRLPKFLELGFLEAAPE
ncbi:MAG: methyltransferase regulatory domain-containing protein [Rhodospirillales bacterium]|nr:methyltransferase regulatory domain-containing protein [Rhodospirillales bacterium]